MKRVGDIIKELAEQKPRVAFPPWTIDRETMVLEHENGYYVEFSRCKTPEAVLDWIFQIAPKNWADKDTINSLVQALRYCLDPQATLCGDAINGSSPRPNQDLIEDRLKRLKCGVPDDIEMFKQVAACVVLRTNPGETALEGRT